MYLSQDSTGLASKPRPVATAPAPVSAVDLGSAVTEIDDRPVTQQPATLAEEADIYTEVFEQAKAALAGMPQTALTAAAMQIGDAAVEDYRRMVNELGFAPGVARQRSVSNAVGRIGGVQQQNGIKPGTGIGSAGSAGSADVTARDQGYALDQYRNAIAKSNAQYTGILKHTPAPTPGSVVSPVAATVDVNQVQTASPAQRLQTALQGQTRVGATGFDASQADQSRAMALQNVQDLQATAAGAGAGQQAAAARLKLALQRSSEMASGRAAQARGAERRGLRRESMLEGGRRALEGATALEAQSAQERQTAQGQLGQQLQATRTTDVDVAAKQSQLDQERKTLQAQLDAARAANNADAVNAINVKMADLEARRQEFNTTARNQAQARAEDQGFSAQNLNNQTGLEVSRLTEEQRVGNERLKLDASKAAQDAAQGLLTENARQEQLAFAREQLRQAKDQADRQFWGGIISSLLSGVASVGAAAVKTSDVRAKTDIAPVRDKDLGDLARAVRDSLATWKYKRAEDGPGGERAGPMAQDLERTRLGRAVTSEREDGTKQVDYAQLATLLAAATVKSRKRAESN